MELDLVLVDQHLSYQAEVIIFPLGPQLKLTLQQPGKRVIKEAINQFFIM